MFDEIAFWLLLACLGLASFSGYLWATRPRQTPLDEHYDDIERGRE